MKTRHCWRAVVALASLLSGPTAFAYVEVPYTLAKVIDESVNVVHVEVTKADQERKYIVFKKVADLKGKYDGEEIKHNIGERGFHAQEWKNIMAWAKPGAQAVMFANNEASETCIGTYWYQCYKEGEWWGMTHAEPFMLRTFHGESKVLADAVTKIVANQEVLVPCLVDANREKLHLRQGKVQMLRAGLKRYEYDPKRDFAGFADGGEIVEIKTEVLVAQSSGGWNFLPAPLAEKLDSLWSAVDFNDRAWQTGKAPLGYGEDQLEKRKGTIIAEQGQPFLFRRAFVVPAALLAQKGVTLRLSIASDNKAQVYLNGKLIDDDPEEDHEFAYWNRDVELTPKQLVPGRNVVAVLVQNLPESSDLYLDAELVAETPIPEPPKAKPAK